MILIERPGWGAAGGRGPIIAGRSVPWVVVHHTGDSRIVAGSALSHEKAIIRRIESDHVLGRGWQGIGYNFLVTPNGHVFEGRGWGHMGAHAPGKNDESVGVCFTMNGDEGPLTPAAIEAFRELVAHGVEHHHLADGYEVVGHRDVRATECPGAKVYAQLEELRP